MVWKKFACPPHRIEANETPLFCSQDVLFLIINGRCSFTTVQTGSSLFRVSLTFVLLIKIHHCTHQSA